MAFYGWMNMLGLLKFGLPDKFLLLLLFFFFPPDTKVTFQCFWSGVWGKTIVHNIKGRGKHFCSNKCV